VIATGLTRWREAFASSLEPSPFFAIHVRSQDRNRVAGASHYRPCGAPRVRPSPTCVAAGAPLSFGASHRLVVKVIGGGR
jgi:hypothetical protein